MAFVDGLCDTGSTSTESEAEENLGVGLPLPEKDPVTCTVLVFNKAPTSDAAVAAAADDCGIHS